jgi:hypothetical protein
VGVKEENRELFPWGNAGWKSLPDGDFTRVQRHMLMGEQPQASRGVSVFIRKKCRDKITTSFSFRGKNNSGYPQAGFPAAGGTRYGNILFTTT